MAGSDGGRDDKGLERGPLIEQISAGRKVRTADSVDRVTAGDANAGGVAATFASEERRGLRLAIMLRIIALLAVALWLALAIPRAYTLFFHLWILLFLALGVAQLLLLKSRHHRAWQPYLFAALDGVLFAVLMLAPNPLLDQPLPPPMALRYANIIFVYVFLAGAAMSYSPGLVLATGTAAMTAWAAGIWWLAGLQGVITSAGPEWRAATTTEAAISLFLDPRFLHLNVEAKKVFVALLVTVLLALVVWRTRRLVRRQVLLERARTNLGRYFSPNMVEELAVQDQPFGPVRRQPVAVLFADILDFTAMSERMPPEAVVAMLRGFHRRMEAAVFACSGTLDKYIGDGLMATFGTPRPGPADARNALAAARRMLAELDAFNRERATQGETPIRVGIGIHYGPVVQGDIGGGRRLEFTVLGDTVNVAARLEGLTRELETPLVVSQALIDRIAAEIGAKEIGPEGTGDAAMAGLDGLTPAGTREIRGRSGKLGLWIMAPAAGTADG
jgi:adenylate cyclase